MRVFSNKAARRVLYFWGVLDVVFVVIYIHGRMRQDEIPYVSDVSGLIRVLHDFDWFVIMLAFLGVALHLSIICSSVFLVLGWRVGLYLSLVQIPFRIFYMFPSLSFVLMVAAYIPGFAPWLFFCLVVVSEAVKAYSLRRALKMEPV